MTSEIKNCTKSDEKKKKDPAKTLVYMALAVIPYFL